MYNFCVIFILCRNAAGDEIWTPYIVIRGAYNFQAHESSAFIKVSMLLAAAYGTMGLSIEPDVAFNLPIVKNEVAHMQLTAWWQSTQRRKVVATPVMTTPVMAWKSLLIY